MSLPRNALFTTLIIIAIASLASAQVAKSLYSENEYSSRGKVLWDAKKGTVYAFYDVRDGDDWQVNVIVVNKKGKAAMFPLVYGVRSFNGKGMWDVARNDVKGNMVMVYYKENTFIGQQIGASGKLSGKPSKIVSYSGASYFAFGPTGKNEFLFTYYKTGEDVEGPSGGIFAYKLNKRGSTQTQEMFISMYAISIYSQVPVAVAPAPQGTYIYFVNILDADPAVEKKYYPSIARIADLDRPEQYPAMWHAGTEVIDIGKNPEPTFFVRYNPATDRHIFSWNFRSSVVSTLQVMDTTEYSTIDNDGKVGPVQMLPDGNRITDAVYYEDYGLILASYISPSRDDANRVGLMTFTPKGQFVSPGTNIPGLASPPGNAIRYNYVKIAPMKNGDLFVLMCLTGTENNVNAVAAYQIDTTGVK